MKINRKCWMLVLLATLVSGNTFAKVKANQVVPGYTIDGKINIPSGTIYLKGIKNKVFFNIDSAKIANGHFAFKGNVKCPDLFGLSMGNSRYNIFIENSPIKIEIDTANHHSAKIYGSVSNDFFESYRNRQGYSIDSLIRTNPKSTVSAYILYRNFANKLTPSQLEDDIALFDLSLADFSYIKDLKEILEVKKKVDIGQKAVDFSALSPDGKTIKLSSYFGNYLLLDFWASWCAPCRRENPNLVKMYNRFKSKGFNIFSVSLDQKKENWIEAIAKDNLTWVHASDLKFWNSEPAKLYAVRSIPSNVLIDPHGNIIGRNLKGEELEKKLEEIFK